MLDSTPTGGVGGGCCCDDPASVPASDLSPLSGPETVETEEILNITDGNFPVVFINRIISLFILFILFKIYWDSKKKHGNFP